MLSPNEFQYTAIALVSLGLTLIDLFFALRVYRKIKSLPLVYLILIHIFLVPFFLSHAILYLIGTNYPVQMDFIFRTSILFLCLIVCTLFFFLEALRFEKPSNSILILAALGAGNGIVLAFIPDTVWWDPVIGPYLADFSRIVFGVDLFLAGVVVSYQILQFIPFIRSELLKSSLLLFVGCLLPILGPAFLIASKISLAIWGIEMFTIALGVLLALVSIIRDERVLRMVPFNVYRLSVMNMNLGLSIFDVLFEAKKLGPDSNTLIPHLMTANLQFVQNVISDAERIRYIQTDNYLFIFEACQNVVGFLIADRSSKLIQSALKEFTREFVQLFGPTLDSGEISQFAKADGIIQKYFAFLPPYKVVSFNP